MLPRLCRPRRIPALLFMPSVFLSQQPTPGKDPQGRGDIWVSTTNCATKRLNVGAERDGGLAYCRASGRVGFSSGLDTSDFRPPVPARPINRHGTEAAGDIYGRYEAMSGMRTRQVTPAYPPRKASR